MQPSIKKVVKSFIWTGLTSLFLLCGSCISNNTLPITAESFYGKWESRQGSFFSSGWDQCEFFLNSTFRCINFPSPGGDLALPYEGTWSLSSQKLILKHTTDNKAPAFYVIHIFSTSFVVEDEKQKKMVYKKCDNQCL